MTARIRTQIFITVVEWEEGAGQASHLVSMMLEAAEFLITTGWPGVLTFHIGSTDHKEKGFLIIAWR